MKVLRFMKKTDVHIFIFYFVIYFFFPCNSHVLASQGNNRSRQETDLAFKLKPLTVQALESFEKKAGYIILKSDQSLDAASDTLLNYFSSVLSALHLSSSVPGLERWSSVSDKNFELPIFIGKSFVATMNLINNYSDREDKAKQVTDIYLRTLEKILVVSTQDNKESSEDVLVGIKTYFSERGFGSVIAIFMPIFLMLLLALI